MAWTAEATVQLIGTLISILGISIASYNHKSIMAASRWLCARSRGRRSQKRTASKVDSAFELPKLHLWDDPDVEAGPAMLAWADEVGEEVEKCCV